MGESSHMNIQSQGRHAYLRSPGSLYSEFVACSKVGLTIVHGKREL